MTIVSCGLRTFVQAHEENLKKSMGSTLVPDLRSDGGAKDARRVPFKILLVEDDASTRMGLTALLQDAGYEVIALARLKEAIKALVEQSPDLLVTDLRLEDSNGLHLVAVNPKQIPVIVITGFPDRVLETEARRFGAAFMHKPIRPAELLELIGFQLSSVNREAGFPHARRWPRKRPINDLQAQVEDAMVRVVDLSYGGMGLEAYPPPSGLPPRSFQVTFPTASLSVPVQVVWQRSSDESWQCGAVVPEEFQPHWRQLVDAVA